MRPFLGRHLVAILLSALLSGLYVRGGAAWTLGFVLLVPWLTSLDATRTLRGTLLSTLAMSLAFTAAVFTWFGIAIGNYTQMGAATGLAALLLAAPLFQPQFLAYGLVRHVTGQRFGPVLRAITAACAWVATEWLVPRLLGDTLGYGLYPSQLLRQGADLGGAAGLTFLLLLANEALAQALARRQDGVRAMLKPLALAALMPLVLAGYGLTALSTLPTPQDKPLRMGLVQSNIIDYERQRQEKGAFATVRDLLDTHFAMSYDAVERQHVDAVLWSETAYPTTFAHPKSAAGAEFDREILDIVSASKVPFVFGTYDRDADGEYNAAAFVEPGSGLLGFYRKTRLFPLTEYVPTWLDGPTLRRWLPWVGTWQRGNGARVLPLRLADGREIPALPLICLDDVDTGLAIDGARLGARVILTMSNDSWFTEHPQGAALHQAVAAFRSIETRLPQFRVTTNGLSAMIDARGSVLSGARQGERTLVIGELPVTPPTRTLMVAWGDWVGRAGAIFLALLAITAVMPSFGIQNAPESISASHIAFPIKISLLPPAARLGAAFLRGIARASLLFMGAAMLLDDSLRNNTLAQIRAITGFFLIPESVAWLVLQAFSAQASIENGALVLARNGRRMDLALSDIAALEPWRLPLPGAGASLRLTSGERWHYALLISNPDALARALATADRKALPPDTPSWATTYANARVAITRTRLDHPLAKFVLLPIVLAIPAFRLHQHIAYGGSFGEYYTFGLKAYLTTFSLWWATWAIGVLLCAAALRAAIEIGTQLTALWRPDQANHSRYWLERLGLGALYLGLPTWLLLRMLGT